MDPKYLYASDGTGDAVLMYLTAPRNAGATTFAVNATTKVPSFFIGTTGLLNSSGYIVPAGKKEFRGRPTGANQITIDGWEPGYTDNGNAGNEVIIIKQTSGWANGVASNIQTQNSTIASFTAANADWRTNLPAISSVVNNGQRSYDITFASTVAAILSPKMRIRTTRGIVAPTQTTLLDGVNKHWLKTSPAVLNTITNGYVVTVRLKVTAYPSGVVGIGGTYNGTSGFYLRMDSTGQVMLVSHNGGSGNWRSIQTKQSVPLNKWVTLVFQKDMSTWTTSPTTNYIMMDDVPVPVFLGTGGTAPTSMGAGGTLYVGALNGANFFPGKISQFGIFNQKVTQTVMRSYSSQSLTNGLPGLVSAYAFDGNGNDINTTNANNLTAQNGATATAADSPFGGQADNSISNIWDYAIVQKVNGTVATVQVAEGCAIPTTGSVTAVYSVVNAPFGFPGWTNKWTIDFIKQFTTTQNSATTAVWYCLDEAQILAPLGEWNAAVMTEVLGVATASQTEVATTFSTSASTSTDNRFTSYGGGSSLALADQTFYRRNPISVPTATSYYILSKAEAAGTITLYHFGLTSPFVVTLENAYL